ncbi:hypothetical protein PVAP13_7NG143900 [Panicum virgatum]|uniref:Uncharacterized protein n=1 Tax=Panicum virgatum TaxID=38727 RepID=A0A8T0PVZ2_PANVG|nr:hypothetical protein PVAP13_7NG143900 [Panicum virgatum]
MRGLQHKRKATLQGHPSSETSNVKQLRQASAFLLPHGESESTSHMPHREVVLRYHHMSLPT